MEITRLNLSPLARAALLYAAWVALFFLLFARSWVSEDAYITFRVIDNFANGYGLRWNTHERVQAYTHPLWLLLHLPFALVVKNLFLLNISLSLLCSVLAVGLVLLTFKKSAEVMLVCFMLPLFFSKCFIDYAGSGLETSLSYLLFACWGYVLVHWQKHPRFLLFFALTSALLLLNRLDHLMMIGPMIAYIAWREREAVFSRRGIGQITLGTLPLIAWFAFSLFYYGFLFPNTKYAKLDTGLPLGDYISQGLQYVMIWLTHDAMSVLIVITALIISLRRDALYKALGLGIALNLAYVIYIGGDYMMGRFFAFIFFASAWLIVCAMPNRMRMDIVFAAAVLLPTAAAISLTLRDIRTVCPGCLPIEGRVIDAKKNFWANKLFMLGWPPRIRTEGQYKFAYEGVELSKEVPPPIKPMRFIGMAGYYAGPRGIFIDQLALADPLLARLPSKNEQGFYVGHYNRPLPKGYLEAVQGGGTGGMDPNLAQYYAKLKLITQGELWSKERFATIIKFNLGAYDHFKHVANLEP